MPKKHGPSQHLRLFREQGGQNRLFDKSLEQEMDEATPPVECLGLTFANDAARRDHFVTMLREGLEELQEKLGGVQYTTVDEAVVRLQAVEKWPMGDADHLHDMARRMRQAESAKDLLRRWKDDVGFPNGEVEDILALSDPPYYTACPNPFLSDVIAHYGNPYDPTIVYCREPFATDVSEGRTDPVYTAHSYHTKVPHAAIMRYILHYTEPGDIVFDGFCGSGMTGVAALLCGNTTVIESLGYRVVNNGVIQQEGGEVIGKRGARLAILNDLSPAATFIASNYNIPANIPLFQESAYTLLTDFGDEFGWMYETIHKDTAEKGRINYTIWSDIFLCSQCQGEIVFWDEVAEEGTIKDSAYCPHCNSEISKENLDRATTTVMDTTVGRTIQKARQVPVRINYSVNGSKYEKKPDAGDMELLTRIAQVEINDWFPTIRIDEDIDLWYERDYRALGIYSIDAFFTRRNLIMVSWFKRRIDTIMREDARLGHILWFWFESILMSFTKMNRYRNDAFSQVNQVLSGTLYVGSLQSED